VAGDAGGAAQWGPAGGEAAFSVGCDPAAKAVVVRRAGGSGSELALSAGDVEGRFPAAVEGGALTARIPLTDAFIDKFGFATGPLTVDAGGEPLTTGAITGSLGRAVRECKRLGGRAATAAAPAAAAAVGAPVLFECTNGKTVTARSPDENTVLLTQGDKTYRLTKAEASTGTRYIGEGRQWWVVGRGQLAAGRLATLPEGQTTTTETGLLCKYGLVQPG
jgi:membrane-bound inhibitor of C-type lysozyme